VSIVSAMNRSPLNTGIPMLTLGAAFIVLPSLVGWVATRRHHRSRSESLPAQMHERGDWRRYPSV